MSDSPHYTIGDGLTKLCEENDQLKAKVAELERELDEWKGRAEIATYQILFGTDTDKATMNSMREQLTKRDLEQQIKALDDIRRQWLAKASEMPIGLECRSKGASCYNWAMYYAQELAHEIEQLRKGAGCQHDWVSARNKVVTSGLICTKCKALKAEGVGDE